MSHKEIHRPLILSEMKSCILRLKRGHDIHLDNEGFYKVNYIHRFFFSPSGDCSPILEMLH